MINREYLRNNKRNNRLKTLLKLLVFLSVILGFIIKNLLIPVVLICISCLIEDVFVYEPEE